MSNELMTPHSTKSPALPDSPEHAALVMFELEVLAKKHDRFGWERDRGTAAQDRLMKDWKDALSAYTLDEIQGACAEFTSDFPSKMPNEGHIRQIIIRKRQRSIAPVPSQPEPEREPPATKEQAANILKQAGVRVNEFGGVDSL